MLRWLVLFVLLLGGGAQAQTRYVTDRTIVELRRGPSTEYLILRNLEAGDEVRILEQDDASGYARVRVADQGTEGWILTRFLTAEPIARAKLATTERNLSSARERVGALESQVATLGADLRTARSELEQIRTNHGAVSQELADIKTASANVIETRDQNLRLQQRLIERDREVEQLSSENARLARRETQNWFIVGAAVLLAGIVIGLVAPTLRRRRRSDW